MGNHISDWLLPTTATFTAGTGYDWLNIDNLKDIDSDYATTQAYGGSPSHPSDPAILTEFELPTFGGHATIYGVEIKVVCKNTMAGGLYVKLLDGTVFGTQQQPSVPYSTTDQTIIVGNSSHLWGVTAAELLTHLQSANFGVYLYWTNGHLNFPQTLSVNYVQIRIHYGYPDYYETLAKGILGESDLTTSAVLDIAGKPVAIEGMASFIFNLTRGLYGGEIVITGASLISDICYPVRIGDILSGPKYLSPDMTGVTILASSTLPEGSYITKYCYELSPIEGGGTFFFIDPPTPGHDAEPQLSASYMYVFSLNGGPRTRYIEGLPVFVRDRLGNWINLGITDDLLTTSLENSYIYEIERVDRTEPWRALPPYSTLLFEEIARQVYGNPDLGILLRQVFVNDFEAAQSIILPNADTLGKTGIKPESQIWDRFPSSRHYEDTEIEE